MTGKIIRIGIVIGWLAFFGYHAVHHLLPNLGLVERRDFASVLSRQLDRVLIYSIQAGGDKQTKAGSCTLSFQPDDNFFRVDTVVLVNDLSVLGLPALPFAGSPSSQGRHHQLDLQLSLRFDDRYRFCSLEGYGNILRFGGRLTGSVDTRGFHGRLVMDDGVEHTIEIPDIAQGDANGLDVVMSLPPGLKPGERFATHVMGVDFLRMQPKQRPAIIAVKDYEMIATAAGDRSLLRVEMIAEDKPEATMWCDDDGTVYRIQSAGGFVLSLDEIRNTAGDSLWPRRTAEPTPP